MSEAMFRGLDGEWCAPDYREISGGMGRYGEIQGDVPRPRGRVVRAAHTWQPHPMRTLPEPEPEPEP